MTSEPQAQVKTFARKHRPIGGKVLDFGAGRPFIDLVFKQQGAIDSNQGTFIGEVPQPFDFETVQKFLVVNVHHSRCIAAKTAATVGLGFESPADKRRKKAKRQGQPEPDTSPEEEIARIDELLDPFCDQSWRDTSNDIAEDYHQVGNGFLEVVREGPNSTSPITGLHHIRAREALPVIEDSRYRRHWKISGEQERHFARFGDLEDYLARTEGADPELVSEVIHFRQPTSLSRWFGFPDWLAAVASIELAQCLTQKEFDFFLNRGVPEFILFLIGAKLHPKDREKIEEKMDANIGFRNQHKSMLVTLNENPQNVTAQLEKLAMESKGDGSEFSSISDTLANHIVSAHGVPPLLAGILIPGKLGATNELVQAMQSFQSLVIRPAQEIFEATLRRTLANPLYNGGLGLTAADCRLNTILDEIDLGTMDTVARMRQSPQEAAAQGRNLGEGLKD